METLKYNKDLRHTKKGKPVARYYKVLDSYNWIVRNNNGTFTTGHDKFYQGCIICPVDLTKHEKVVLGYYPLN